MNYVSLITKTDFSLLSSLIKVDELINYGIDNHYQTLSICDINLYGVIEFYLKCQKNNIKPVIGLEIKYQDNIIYLFAKNYTGYQNLLKIEKDNQSLIVNNDNILVIIPYKNIQMYKLLNEKIMDCYIGYNNDYEKKNALIVTQNIVYINETRCLDKNDCIYLNYLDMIKLDEKEITYDFINYQSMAYNSFNINDDDLLTINNFIDKINIIIPENIRHMPLYDKNVNEELFLKELCLKGLNKRFNNDVKKEYMDRLNYELNIIIEMKFVSYFLVVYDYVLYAKKNNIMIGPGRGSAASSLVSYSLGITEVDPLKYDLLFERFLNPKRISLPDIDIDMEDIKREEIIKYVTNKYGSDNVGLISTYSTLGVKQVLIDLGSVLEIDEHQLKYLLRLINPKESLTVNLNNISIIDYIKTNKKIQKLIKIALKLENIKKYPSIHAAGVVISNEKLNSLVPTYEVNNQNVIGVTYPYLEPIGLIKMDFLGLNNLAIIHDCLAIIENKINITQIPLDDNKTYELFSKGDTLGIFQFESEGIKNFVQKLKPNKLSDLYLALAMYRPGPIDNIDDLLKRRENNKYIAYIDEKLKPILNDTYGIIIYQEQIMEIFRSLGNYSYSEADIVRKAISKKNMNVINMEKNKFITGCLNNGILEENAIKIFDLIVKFADYGFNKAHSVAYSIISYELAYLKANYPLYFILNFLNRNIGSSKAVNEWIRYAQNQKIEITICDINLGTKCFYLKDNKIVMPLSIIKGMNENKIKEIVSKRNNGYLDIFDFITRMNKVINHDDFTNLIYAGCFDKFNNRQTLINNIDVIYNYASLACDSDYEIVKPLLQEFDEYTNDILLEKEIEVCGMYISNHPSVFYADAKDMKANNIENYFDKIVKTTVLVERIKDIETKKKEKMCFITGSDDTGVIDYTIFPNRMNLLNTFKRGDIVKIIGKVSKRNDKYSIIINSVLKINK